MATLAPSAPAAPSAMPSGAATATAAAPAFGNEPPMTEPEVDEALRLNSPLLVAEVYETTKKNVENYGLKLARLDQKATALLGAIGLSLTVAFTYGGQQIAGHAKDMTSFRWTLVLVMFWSALLAGLSAGVYAAVALFVSDHAEMSDRAIYNAQELREADALEPEEQAKGLASYRRAVTLHLWVIAKQREQKLRKKAKAVRRGQACFLAFLAILLLVCVEITTRIA